MGKPTGAPKARLLRVFKRLSLFCFLWVNPGESLHIPIFGKPEQPPSYHLLADYEILGLPGRIFGSEFLGSARNIARRRSGNLYFEIRILDLIIGDLLWLIPYITRRAAGRLSVAIFLGVVDLCVLVRHLKIMISSTERPLPVVWRRIDFCILRASSIDQISQISKFGGT